MKYPQLVSTKAVNEISDWLIKRLEDLDIEHPGVYSRLLLSLLLHTPSKVNAIDLLEDLKEPYRFANKNNEELKRLAAVESLMEVSAEENKSSIVSLVDELHSKLRKFESGCEDNSMNINRASNSISSASPNRSNNKNLKKIKRNHGIENSSVKNYYLAFPALNNGNKKLATSSTMPRNGQKQPLLAEIEESDKKSNLLSWSNLMSNKKETSTASSLIVNSDKGYIVKTPTRKRRYGKAYNKGFQKKNDVQFTTKSFTMYDNNATFSPKKMVKSSSSSTGRKQHQRNQQYDASAKIINKNSNRNNNFSNAQNAPKMDDLTPGSSGAPWDMDFRGHWEMDRDLIKEFIQQQKEQVSNYQYQPQQMEYSYSTIKDETSGKDASQAVDAGFNEDEDDVMLMKCLPTKLMIEESVDDPLNGDVLKKPFNSKETLSVSSLKSKFDENVKALWSDVDGIDALKPLTCKHLKDDGSASLASSFTSEKNSLSLFNFNEQQTHHFEVNAPCTEIYQQHQLYKSNDYDCNNNNPTMVFHGGRGAISKNSSFNASPKQSYPLADQMTKSIFIKSGTNLQASIWSDGGDYTSDAESLIFKDVADPKNTSTDTNVIFESNTSTVEAEIKQQWQASSQNIDVDEEVTLFNHSERSAFKKFRPILNKLITRANYHPLNVDYNDQSVLTSDQKQSTETAENYLTSEKTHFSPIIRDGHTFVIDNNWDGIQYERSTSGGITYKNKRYKVWNNSRLPNINPDIDIIEMENESSEFIIKYMLSDNHKSCQTNENDFVKIGVETANTKNHTFMEINEEYCKRKIYDEYFRGINDTPVESRNKWRYVNNGDDSNDYSFFTVNRVKNNNNSSNNLTSQTFQDILLSSNSSSSSICTITSSQYDPSESWRNNKPEKSFNNNVVDSDYKQTCMHRLWEQCLTCTQLNEDSFGDKSLPANRLMKDELQLDGDEIMNVIQNLYITSDYCDEEEKEEDCEEFDMNHVYMNMIMDDSMDGTCTLEDESKFYDSTVDAKNHKNLTSTKGTSGHQRKEVMNLEDFDQMTLTQWQWNKKTNDSDLNDHEKYLKLFDWIKNSLAKNHFNNFDNENSKKIADKNNNDCQSLNEIHRPKNRKRRHSTCQNFLENKRYHSHEEGFTYHLNLDNCSSSFLEKNTNLFFDAGNMLKLNIEKILLIHTDPCFDAEMFLKESNLQGQDQIGGANYYRNILQQQHALIKHLDLTRPLTR